MHRYDGWETIVWREETDEKENARHCACRWNVDVILCLWGGAVTADNHEDAPSLATIARKCGSGLSLYKNDDGKQQLDASGNDFSGNKEVDCVLDSGAVPSDVADAITEAQHGSETISKSGSTDTYHYKWKVEFVDNPAAPAVKIGMTSISLIEK